MILHGYQAVIASPAPRSEGAPSADQQPEGAASSGEAEVKRDEITAPDSTRTRLVVGDGITLDISLSTAQDVTRQLDASDGTHVRLLPTKPKG